MRLLRLPPQITRLVLLTVGIIGSYSIARYYLVPPSFGEFGWYRANALGEIASAQPVYAGKPACEECHSDEYQMVTRFEHKTLSCEACHGPGRAHADNPDMYKMTILTFSHCVRCHEANPSRPKWHKQITSKDHYTGQVCTECHIPHHPGEAPP